jgi:NAD(P)-dependent dehydrogenase (short-subunit alcohol dehydrogenase family)
MQDLHGAVAIVTGAASGIGRAGALAFAAAGSKVVVADIDDEGGHQTVKLVEEAGGQATFVRCDVSQDADVRNLIARTISTYGRLDCAFNNAGTDGDILKTIVDCTEENWQHTIDVNLKGTYLCIKYEIPEMLKVGGGAIVNTSSQGGLTGNFVGDAYGAAKHGVIGLTKFAALEFADKNVRVNAVCPGYTNTPQAWRFVDDDPEKMQAAISALHPNKRLIETSEVAEVAVWLCQSTGVNGASVPVDGGWVIA